MSSSALLKALDRVDEQHLNLHSLLVIRNGYLVSEVYYNPFTAEMAAPVASVTKSVTSALVGIAIDKGYIKDEQAKVLSFFPNQTIANLDERKQAMTVRDLVTMTGGLDYTDAVDPAAEALTQSKDWVSFMLDRPMAASPGSTYSYSTGAAHLLSGVLAKATGETPRVFANENLFQPLGIAPVPESGWAGRSSRCLVRRRGSVAHAEGHGKDRLPLPQGRQVGRLGRSSPPPGWTPPRSSRS